MNTELLALGSWFAEVDWPSITCPNCKIGYVSTPRSRIKYIQSADSKKADTDPDWEPDWDFGYFSADFLCRRRDCRAVLVVTGEYRWQDVLGPRGGWHGEYEKVLRVRLIMPPLQIAKEFPVKTPTEVLARLGEASFILWADPNSAGNKLRVAIEILLNFEKIPRYHVVKHKRRVISLHNRLIEFEKWVGFPARIFLAVKWIGNEGSHSTVLNVEDVLEAVDLLHNGIELLYGNSEAELERKVRKINKAKGIDRKNSH